jgi:uncharacterized membrane protein YqgA involved in biofilm formation
MLEKIMATLYCLFRRYEVEICILGLIAIAIGVTIYSKDGTFLALITPIAIGAFVVDIRKIDEEEWP